MSSIVVNKLSFGYDKSNRVLHNVSFKADTGESIGIVGANGAGKSTLLKLLVGLNLAYTGSIEINGIQLNKDNLNCVRKEVGYVFQDSESQLFMATVEADVAFAPKNYGLSPEQVKKNVSMALEETKITHLRDKPIYKLSGGEKKLASLATILSLTPSILLFDEPTVGLDPKNRRNLIHLLNQMDQMKLITSHDLDFILDTCERTMIIADGKIVADGNTQEILTNEELLEQNGLELPLSLYRK